MTRNRFKKFKTFAVIATIIAGSWALQRWAYSEEIVRIDGKQAQAIDGDSFRIGDTEFRIYGIDAPEYRQNCVDDAGKNWPCGKSARTGLEAILRGAKFSCEVRARDQYGRAVVICRDPQERDLGSLLVEQGLAVSGHVFDESIYAVDEAQAKKAKRGIWRGTFIRPDIWRAQNPRK